MKEQNESVKKLEMGKDYVNPRRNIIVIDRHKNYKNNGFQGKFYYNDLSCHNPTNWREATEEEVIEAFEKHLVHRYGEDWETMKIKERHPTPYLSSSIVINDGSWSVDIAKLPKGWDVWNKNGLLYRNGVWVERLEEPKIHIQEAIKKNTIIHCATEKEAERILGMAHALGYKWRDNESYVGDTRWDVEKSKTFYYLFKGTYGNYDNIKERNYTIIPSTQIEDLVVEKKTVPTPAQEKNLDSFTDIDLVLELRKRGYEVTAERTIKL